MKSRILQRIRNTSVGEFLAERRRLARLRRWSCQDSAAEAFFRQFVTAGSLCFDVGANIGLRTKVFRHLGAQVVAVEPQGRCCRILRSLYGHDPLVSVVQRGIGSRWGEACLHTSASTRLSTFREEFMEKTAAAGRFHPADWAGTEVCQITTLDSLIQVFGIPSFIKIDVEGFEREVLAGLNRAVPSLSFEFTRELLADAEACIERLRAIGFSVFAFSPEESFHFPEGWQTSAAIQSTLAATPELAWGDIYVRA